MAHSRRAGANPTMNPPNASSQARIPDFGGPSKRIARRCQITSDGLRRHVPAIGEYSSPGRRLSHSLSTEREVSGPAYCLPLGAHCLLPLQATGPCRYEFHSGQRRSCKPSEVNEGPGIETQVEDAQEADRQRDAQGPGQGSGRSLRLAFTHIHHHHQPQVVID